MFAGAVVLLYREDIVESIPEQEGAVVECEPHSVRECTRPAGFTLWVRHAPRHPPAEFSRSISLPPSVACLYTPLRETLTHGVQLRQTRRVSTMPTFDIEPKEITVFPIEDEYWFSHYFDREDLFELQGNHRDRIDAVLAENGLEVR